MQSQAFLSQKYKLPQKMDCRTKKDKLFNDLIELFEERGWTWVDCGDALGKAFLLKLCDVLWYIDGHHEVFANCSLPIPDIFKSFTGYNTPKLSKHRKRKASNMSYDVLVSHVSCLKECILTSWMQQGRWHDLREIVDELATSLGDCTTYLCQHSKVVKQKQDSLSVSDTGRVKLLPINASVSGRIEPLYTALQEKPVYSKVDVNTLALMDPKLKYQFMNYFYLWIIPGVTIESAMNENMQIISQIKEELPSYHSRVLK